MRRARTRTSGLTGVILFFLMVGLADSSAVFGQPIRENLEAWYPIEPALISTLYAECSNEPTSTSNPGASSNPVTIKVGHAYLFDPYTPWEAAKLGLELFWNPNEVVAKRTFELYDVKSLSTTEWGKLVGSKQVMAGIFVRADGGYFGTPVHWDSAFTNVISDALGCAETKKDKNNVILSAIAGEIINLGKLKIGPEVGTPKINVDAQQATIENYYQGNAIDISGVLSEIYIGFSETPVDFDLDPADTLITRSGAQGQPLGTVMPSWPSKDWSAGGHPSSG